MWWWKRDLSVVWNVRKSGNLHLRCNLRGGNVCGWKILKREYLLNWPKRILDKGRPGWADTIWGYWQMRRVIQYWRWGIGRNQSDLLGFLLNLGSWRTCPRREPNWWRVQRSLIRVRSRREPLSPDKHVNIQLLSTYVNNKFNGILSQ